MGLNRFSAFAEAIEDWSLPDFGELDGFLSGLCRMAARLYNDHPHQRIAYVHSLTIPSALRLFEGLLPESEACRLGIHAFQSVAAMHSIFGATNATRDPDDEVDRVSENWDEIRYHVACSLQEHSIKMVEACWRENQIREDPIFRRAAADTALKIDGRGRSADC